MPILVPGTAFVTATPTDLAAVVPTFATTDVTAFIDGPTGRKVWRWRPSGTSSPEFTNNAGTNTLTLSLTSAWTADNLATNGAFHLYFCSGLVATTQALLGVVTIQVIPPPLGPAPTTGG